MLLKNDYYKNGTQTCKCVRQECCRTVQPSAINCEVINRYLKKEYKQTKLMRQELYRPVKPS